MMLIVAIAIFLILCFGFVIMFGAPYLPTLKPQIETALELLELKKGQRLIELGSGDGRVLLAAAKRGLYVTGYELNPILVLYSRLLTFRYRSKVKIIWGNYWYKDWPITDGIYVFLLQKYMTKLNNKVIRKYSNPINLVSFAFKIPDRAISNEKKGIFLYRYNQ